MLREERQWRILDVLDRQSSMPTDALAAELSVSAETIRRDLKDLEQQGRLRRVHGGATSLRTTAGEASHLDRSRTNLRTKQQIAQIAAALTDDDMTIVLDLGTTAVEVARALRDSTFQGAVITTSLLVAAELVGAKTIETIICPGRVRSGDLAVSGGPTASFLDGIRSDIAFIGSGAVDASAIRDFHLDEVAAKKIAIGNAARSYVLADSSKLGASAPYKVCDLTEITGVITDRTPPVELRNVLDRSGCEVHNP